MKCSKKWLASLLIISGILAAMPCLVFAGKGAEHRNQVSQIVRELNAVAAENTDIGQEARAVAQAQSTTTEDTVQAMEKIENRSKIRTFLIGTDYKNIGKIRSELATTANHINRLKNALQRATGTDATASTTQARLQEQIRAMEQEQTKVQAFVQANEGKFSLFGWLAKLFQ